MKPNTWLTLACGLLLVLGGRNAQADDLKATPKCCCDCPPKHEPRILTQTFTPDADDLKATPKCCCEKTAISKQETFVTTDGYQQVRCCAEQQATACPQGKCCTQTVTGCPLGQCCTQATTCAQGKCCTQSTDCCQEGKAVASKCCKDLDLEICSQPSCCKEGCCPMQVVVGIVKACLESCASLASSDSCKCSARTACTSGNCCQATAACASAPCTSAAPVCGFRFFDVMAPVPFPVPPQVFPHPVAFAPQGEVFQVALPHPQVMELVQPPLPHFAMVAGVPVPYEVLPQPRKITQPAPVVAPHPMPATVQYFPPMPESQFTAPAPIMLTAHAVPAMPKVVSREKMYFIKVSVLQSVDGKVVTLAAPRIATLAGQTAEASFGGFITIADGSIKDLTSASPNDSSEVCDLGTKLNIKVSSLGDGRVRCALGVCYKEIESATQDGITIQGHTVNCYHKVKTGEVVKVVLQKDHNKQPSRWVEFCVTEGQ